jgi:hypothetical protein
MVPRRARRSKLPGLLVLLAARSPDVSLPLVLAAAAFLAVLVWRVRPFVGGGTASKREVLRDVQAKVEAAKDDAERAVLLCEAAERVGGWGAKGLYQRAMRADPRSVNVVERMVVGLARKPRAVESLLWRHLSSVPWTDAPDASRAALDALRVLYEGRLKNAVRARAMANARDAIASRL